METEKEITSKISDSKNKIFTHDEELFSKISYKKLLEILKRKDIQILNLNKSYNSYGSFQFITIKQDNDDEHIVLYGLGLHEYRNKYFVNEFHFYINSYHEKDLKILDKKEAIKKLEKLYKEFKEFAENNNLDRTSDDAMFEQMADMADDDAVISMLY